MHRMVPAAFAAITLMVAATNSFAEAPITIKFSHVVAEDTPKGQAALAFKHCAEAALPGRVKVEVYPHSQLHTDNTVLEAMLRDEVQMAAPSTSKFEKYTKAFRIFDLPFLFSDLNAVEAFQASDKGKELLQSMKDAGMLGLAYWHNGMKQMSANTPLRLPADAHGLKFRIMNSDILKAQFEQIGAVPIKKSFSEVYTLLRTKAIDGAENPWSNIYSERLHEVQAFISETNHGLLEYVLVTSVNFWNNLPEDVKPVLETCVASATHVGNSRAREIAMDAKRKIAASGHTRILELTDDEKAAWREAMKPVWELFAQEIGREMIEAARTAQ